MRFWFLLGGMILAFFMGQGRSHGATGQDALAELKTAMRLEIQQAGGSSGAEGGRGLEKQSMLAQVGQIRVQMAQGNNSYAQEILMRVSALFISEAVARAAEKAQAQLVKEAADRDAEFVKSTEAALREVMAAAVRANSAAEIDPLITRAGEMRVNSRGQQSEEAQRQMNRVQYAQRFLQQWQDYVFAREAGEAEKARNLAREMASNSDWQNFIPRSQLLELAAGKKPGRKPSRSGPSLQEQFAALFKAAVEAKDTSAVDALLEKGGEIKYEPAEMLDASYSAQRYAADALRWMGHWRDFLQAMQEGRLEEAKEKLNESRSSEMELIGVPRARLQQLGQAKLSAVLEREQARFNADLEKLKHLKSLEEMAALAATIPEPSMFDRSAKSALLKGLLQLNTVYQNLKAGLPPPVFIQMRNGAEMPELAAMRGQLALYAVPKLLNVPAGAVPAPGEGVWLYVGRLIREARATGEPQEYERAMQAIRFLSSLQNDSLEAPVEDVQAAMKAEQTARNMDQAGQTMLAVYFYNEALRSGGTGFPTQKTAAALAKIKTEHPEDFAEGNRQFLTIGPELAARSAEFMRAQMVGRAAGPQGMFPRPGPGSGRNPTPSPAPTATPQAAKKQDAPNKS